MHLSHSVKLPVQNHTAEKVVSITISKEKATIPHFTSKSCFRADFLRNNLVRLSYIPAKRGERTHGKFIRFPDLIHFKKQL